MLPGFKPLKLYKGDTFAFRLTLGIGESDYDITDHIFTAQIKEKGKTTVTSEFDYEIEDAEAGIVLLTLSATEASKLNASKRYEYDVQMDNGGVVSTIIKGPVVVVNEVSS